MIKARYSDKAAIVNLLAKSFNDNISVNYVVKQDGQRVNRIRYMMGYAFEKCWMFGDVFWSDDKKGVALVEYPLAKKISLRSVLLDIKLVIRSIGVFKACKVLRREAVMNKYRPKIPYAHLWFLGVENKEQRKGIGLSLLRDFTDMYEEMGYPIFVETSMKSNLPFYEKLNFDLYHTIAFDHELYMLKRGEDVIPHSGSTKGVYY